MVQYGRVWYGMVEYGTVWYSMVQYGRVWNKATILQYHTPVSLTIGEGQGSLSIHTVQVCQIHLHKNNLHELNVLRERSYISDLCVNSCR